MKHAILTSVILVLALLGTLATFGVNPIAGLQLIIEGSFGDKFGLTRTFVKSTPVLLCGLGMAIAWRAKMYNIGGEGQYALGGLFGASIIQWMGPEPNGLKAILVITFSAIGGGLLASFSAWLQLKRGVQCVVSTILLNFIIFQGIGWAIRGPIQEPTHKLPQSLRLSGAQLLTKFDPQTDLHIGVFFAFLLAFFVGMVMTYTKIGFLNRFVGHNAELLKVYRHDPRKLQVLSMSVSGALCGIAGGLDYYGVVGQISDKFPQGFGFLSIPVALLGGLNPFGILGSSLFFGALIAGSDSLSRFTNSGSTLVLVIQAVAVLVVLGLTGFVKRREALD